ncbi:TIGR04388 family protein [Leptospira yanagawae]|uniref:TIGR04388 family protein n=1 Tax=Leptospira yanagawae TaxID=293069 RepID=A0ABY2M3E8_9LEPT|nr:TIGR04388 family protein [Leptospira yanagawae]TGL23041.1 TIGR04388 family protein [Leptospira yanagawae]
MKHLAKYKQLLIILILFGYSLRSQVLVPDLEVPGYETNFMREVYGRSYFLGSLSSWNEQVLYYQDMLRASWEDRVDEAIFEYVNSITTSDAINDVNAYKDYVFKELESQKAVALTSWEETANLDLLSNREEFLSRLTSSQLDESYITRMGMTQYYNQLKSYQEAQRLQSEIQAAANSWSQNFNQNFQQGINDFTTAFGNIESNYQNLLNSIDANDQAFQTNLNAINEYKSFVKDSIRSVITSFEEELGKSCSERYGCVYRDANNELNQAGQKLQSLVNLIKPKLNDNALNPTMELTLFSQQMRDFLADQQIGADTEFNKYNPWVTSLQTNPFVQYVLSDSYSGYQYSSGTKANLESYVRNGGYDYWSSVTGRPSWWTGEGDNDFGLLDLVNALQVDYNNGDSGYTQLSNVLRGLLGPGKELTQIHLANAFARDIEQRNNAKFLGYQIAYVDRSGREGNMLAGANSFSYFGLPPGQTGWNQWTALRCAPFGCWVDHHQMDSVSIAISYSVKDTAIESQANYWKSIDTSMQGQVGKYNTEILPAVQNWEAQVANYDKFYTEWKVQAQEAKEKAQADYEASIASLEEEKQAWIANSQNEYRDGYLQWSELSANAQSGKAALTDIRTEIRAISTGSNASVTRPVGLSALVDSFTTKIESIANQGFTFTDQPVDSFLNTTTRLQAGESSTGSYTLLGAFNQKSVSTSLEIGGKEFSSIIQGTTTGIYQYSQLISANDSNRELAFREQEKMLNRNSWNVEYSSVEIGTMVDGQYTGTGLSDEAAINRILKELTNSARYQLELERCQATAKPTTDCFSDVVHKGRLDELSSLGYEYKEGKIVRKLDRSEEIRLGLFKDYESLSQAEKEQYGSCYEDPSKCMTSNGKNLLRKDFDYTIDKQTNVATLTRVINNGQIARREGDNFFNGTQVETRKFNLAQVMSVMAPKGRDLFDTWGQSDWEDFSAQSSDKLKTFYEVDLAAVNKTTQNAVTSIRKIESHNEKKFQTTVDGIKSQEAALKELVMAYLSGGMAGVKAAIKNKVEDKINSSLAEAFIRATGGTMEDLQRMSDAFSFARGRIEQKKIKAKENYYSVNDLGGSIERYFKNIDPMTATARRVFEVLPQIPIIGPLTTLYTGVGLAVTKEVLGEKNYNATMDRITARKDRLVEIKANERSMAKSYVDRAISEGSGISLDLVSQQSTDFLGARDAARVRNANNARWGVVDQAVGVVGGIVKTAFNAFGMKDRHFAASLNDANRLLFAGNVNTTYGEKAALAGANQTWGMSGPGLSYQTNVLKLSDKEGIVKEFGQQALVKEIARIQGWDKDIVNSIVRKEYGKYEQRQTDKKVQADAIRETAKLAASFLLPGGIAALAGQLAKAGQVIGKLADIAQKIANFYNKSEKVFTAIVRGAVQIVDGSRNGVDGIVAGAGNALLGYFGATGTFDFGANMGIFSQSAVGLGISYDKERGYGGMIGIGNSTTNASVGFYQHGATTLDASYGFKNGSQMTLSHSGNSTQVGVSYNEGRGDREGFNYSLNYDIQQGMASAGVSYTIPGEGNWYNKAGLNLNLDRYGLTSSAQYDGVTLASMGPAGFSMQEYDWAMLNINEAQDRQKLNQDKSLALRQVTEEQLKSMTQDQIESIADIERSRDTLVENGLVTKDGAKNLSPEEITAKLNAFESKQNADNTAAGAATAGSLAFMMLGYLGLGRKENDADGAVVKENTLKVEPAVTKPKTEQSKTKTEKVRKVADAKPKVRKEGTQFGEVDPAKKRNTKSDGKNTEITKQSLKDKLIKTGRDGLEFGLKVVDSLLFGNLSADPLRKDGKLHTKNKSEAEKVKQVEKLSQEKNTKIESENQKTTPIYDPSSKLNQIIDSLKGKSKAEVKEYFRLLTGKELNSLVADSKKLSGELKDTKLTIEKTSSIPYRDREINPAKIASYEKINDKLDRFLSKEYRENKLKEHYANFDAANSDYQKTISSSESLKYISESIKNLDNIDSPLRKQIEDSRDNLFKLSDTMSNGAIVSFLSSVRPTADQLNVASKIMEDYKKDRTKKIDLETARIIAKQLTLDPEFSAMAQPQKLKDSYSKLMDAKTAAEKGFADTIQKFQNKELTQAQLISQLTKLESDYSQALKKHQDNWKVYQEDVAKMIQNRDSNGKITVPSLDKVSVGIISDGPLKYKDVTARYRIYEDSAGNKKLIASGEAALYERATQREDFMKAIEKIPTTIKIDPGSGHLLTGLDGKPLTMSPNDAERRKAAVEEIKINLGAEFDPKNNPNFAKLEAIGNFRFDEATKNYCTTVNGIDFQFGGTHNVSPEVSIVKADGANWMKLSGIAKDTDITSIGLSSVLREDGSSHKGGYSFDVSYVKDQNGKTSIIKYNGDFQDGEVPQPKPPLDKFLDRVSTEASNKFSYNPYYLVDQNGNKIPNFFTAVGKDNWTLTEDWDGLKAEQRTQFSKMMREMALKHDPPFTLNDDNVKQMWNHRHHLHVTEINK